LKTLLLVDDDPQGRLSTQRILEAEGYSVVLASDGQQALDRVRQGTRFDAILSDVRMPNMDGLDFFKALSVLSCPIPVVLMTAYGRLDQAVWAMKLGAVDFLSKPFKRRQLLDAVGAAMARPMTGTRTEPEFTTRSSGMLTLMNQVEQVAGTSATILVQGESGSGKERIARLIHDKSQRRAAQFIAINCAAIPESLLETELFGHEKGAFTGALQAKRGLFEAASGGTLLLDEIGDMPLSLQSKLLRVLQESEVRRVGSLESKKVDVRIIAATHQDLRMRVAEGRFREDLLYRLEVIALTVPPLRERREDLPDLIQGIFDQARVRHAKTSVQGLKPEAITALVQYSWPGNVRELSNAVERAIILCQGTEVALADLPGSVTAQSGAQAGAQAVVSAPISIPMGTALKDVEDLLIRKTLEATDGDKELTARILGITARTIYRKLGHKDGQHA